MLQVLTIRQGPGVGAELIREARAARRSRGNLLDRMIASLDAARARMNRDDETIEQDVVATIRKPH
jgi:hypothetical protein